jgi:hypothetical protein
LLNAPFSNSPIRLLNRRILLTLLVILSLVQPVQARASAYRYTMTYVFENRGQTPLTLTEEDITVPLFMNTSTQTVKVKESSVGYTSDSLDVDDNRVAVMNVDKTLSSGQSISFTVSFDIGLEIRSVPDFGLDKADGFSSIPSTLVDQYTGASETFMSDDPDIVNKALEVAGDTDTVLKALILLIESVTGETTYSNYEVPRYPNTTLSEGLGDCDDQSILLISMLRSLGVPAYLQVGIYMHPSIEDSQTSWEGHLTDTRKGVGWHGWAMVYVPPWGWVPVDLTLTSEKNGLELLKNAPEYGGNVIVALNVSEQPYIGDTLTTRARIVASSLYVTMTDEAEEVYSGGLGSEIYLVAGLGLAVAAAIALMFVSGRKGSG